MSELREQIMQAAANILPTPIANSIERMEGFSDGQECENARLLPLVQRLAEVAEAVEIVKNDLEDGGAYLVADGFKEPAPCLHFRVLSEALVTLTKELPDVE